MKLRQELNSAGSGQLEQARLESVQVCKKVGPLRGLKGSAGLGKPSGFGRHQQVPTWTARVPETAFCLRAETRRV